MPPKTLKMMMQVPVCGLDIELPAIYPEANDAAEAEVAVEAVVLPVLSFHYGNMTWMALEGIMEVRAELGEACRHE